jgi:hypothetical protein
MVPDRKAVRDALRARLENKVPLRIAGVEVCLELGRAMLEELFPVNLTREERERVFGAFEGTSWLDFFRVGAGSTLVVPLAECLPRMVFIAEEWERALRYLLAVYDRTPCHTIRLRFSKEELLGQLADPARILERCRARKSAIVAVNLESLDTFIGEAFTLVFFAAIGEELTVEFSQSLQQLKVLIREEQRIEVVAREMVNEAYSAPRC